MKLKNFYSFIFVVSISALSFLACSEHTQTAQNEKDASELPVVAKPTPADTVSKTTIQWTDSTFQNLGKIGTEDSITVIYRFKNTGNKPLIIQSVNTSCGCTVPDTLYEPVLPGQASQVRVKFYAKNQAVATHQKQVYVSANTKPHTGTILTFRVEISDRKR